MKHIYSINFLLLLFVVWVNAQALHIPANKLSDLCNSKVYCNGELLQTVQMFHLFPDSKTFVDLYQKNSETVTLKNFARLVKSKKNKLKQKDVCDFIKANFATEDVLRPVKNLKDFKSIPDIYKRIKDPIYRNWTIELNNIWPTLARKIDDQVKRYPDRFSLIYVKNPFIIPGGRFKETYYWDSYWIIEGLLLSGLHETAKGMIDNLVSLVKRYGFVPNGARVYYLMRSQPPLLAHMIEKYYEITQDEEFVRSVLPYVEQEFNHWHEKKTVKISYNNNNYKLARYTVNSFGPRPESYREDYSTYKTLENDPRQLHFYENIKAHAETGWDFSARWLDDHGKFTDEISKTATCNIFPVDLNSFIEKNARILSKLYAKCENNRKKAAHYNQISKNYQKAIHALMWNSTDGIWYDYHLNKQGHNVRFYVSNMAPLYTKSFPTNLNRVYGRKVLQYLERMDILRDGGIPTSLDTTGQQWDFPNAWAPLMSMVVQGLRNTYYPEAQRKAKEIASLWLRTNYEAFISTNAMHEKYNVMGVGCAGDGGEYEPQTGFGWTNGVVLEFLNTYPDIVYNESFSKNCPETPKRKKRSILDKEILPLYNCEI